MKNNQNNQEVKLSRFISFVLRHNPDSIKIKIEEDGWTNTKEFIENINKLTKYRIDMELLEKIVKEDNKQRYSFNENKSKIRANQGHSINAKIRFKEVIPPDNLYHGTGDKYVFSILKEGIKKRTRNFVHLSDNIETAFDVGSRHGQPKVLIVNAKEMHKDKYKFFLSENGVYLTEYVPIKYIKQLKK